MSAAFDDDVQEMLVAQAPVTVRRRVMWGECDPAQVVYTPRFADYAASAATWFWRVLMRGQQSSLKELGLFTPVKHLSFVFHKVLRPEDIFDMVVRVTDMRTKSLDLAIEASATDGTPRFSAVLTPIIVSMAAYEAIAIPQSVREAIEEYRERSD